VSFWTPPILRFRLILYHNAHIWTITSFSMFSVLHVPLGPFFILIFHLYLVPYTNDLYLLSGDCWFESRPVYRVPLDFSWYEYSSIRPFSPVFPTYVLPPCPSRSLPIYYLLLSLHLSRHSLASAVGGGSLHINKTSKI
jgi:hypothetical protein